MTPQSPEVDHSIWRYYRGGGKGFAARCAERSRSAPRLERCSEKETLAHAVGGVRRQKTAGGAPARRGKERSPADAAIDRVRQALLGMVLSKAADGDQSPIPAGETSIKARVEKMPDETLKKMAGFLSSSEAATALAGQPPVLRSLDEELAKRGISLQLSGKVNNVYLSGANSSWAVNASAGGDGEAVRNSGEGRGSSRPMRYNNFGQTLGRAAKNFILGH